MINLKKTDKHSLGNTAKAKLGGVRCQEIWVDVLNEEVGCSEELYGNRPCDSGAACDKCHQEIYGEMYVDRMIAAAKDL